MREHTTPPTAGPARARGEGAMNGRKVGNRPTDTVDLIDEMEAWDIVDGLVADGARVSVQAKRAGRRNQAPAVTGKSVATVTAH